MPEPLHFYDHHRQRYAGKVSIPEAGEFMIGDYTGEGTVGRDGEFKITLVELHGARRWSLYLHLEVFGEGAGALRRGIDAGLLDVLRPPVNSRDEFGRRLLEIGLIDRSDNPANGGRTMSDYDKGDRRPLLGFGEPDPTDAFGSGHRGDGLYG